eukprot:gene18635-23817_t
MIVGLYFGRYVLGMNPILLLGGLAGAQTMTAGMAAVQDRSGSTVAVLGYTPAVPIGHILLTTLNRSGQHFCTARFRNRLKQ